MRDFIQANVSFSVGNRPVSFTVIHNMPLQFGLNFDCALDNWLARTTNFTAKSLCKYIMSKQPDVVAMTEKQFNRLNKISK